MRLRSHTTNYCAEENVILVRRTNALFCADITAYNLKDDIVLFLERKGDLVRLNPTAALVWRGLQSGLSSRDIIDSLVQVCGAPAMRVERDVSRLTAALNQAGVLGASAADESQKAAQAGSFRNRTAELPLLAKPQRRRAQPRDRSYCLVDLRFCLRMPSVKMEREAHQLLSHLSISPTGSPSVFLEVVERDHQWLLLREGEVVDLCASSRGVIPMLHANILLMAYCGSGCIAAFHAAAVNRGSDCILLPASAGSGKSTLVAALLCHGFGYCTDDLALLTQEPVRIRPVRTCLGLKPGSWSILADLFPEIENLSIHIRPDGKQVRYLPPPTASRATPESYMARLIVFPTWSPGSRVRIRNLSSAEALARLTASGYDLPKRIDRNTVECLIRWISDRPRVELTYPTLKDAVREISSLMP